MNVWKTKKLSFVETVIWATKYVILWGCQEIMKDLDRVCGKVGILEATDVMGTLFVELAVEGISLLTTAPSWQLYL